MKDKFWISEVDSEPKEAKIATDDGDSESENRVSSANNRIYFYSEVNRTKVLSLNKNIQTIGTKLQNHATLSPLRPHVMKHSGLLLSRFETIFWLKSYFFVVHFLVYFWFIF